MTGNSIAPQILASSTVAGASIAVLPATGASIFVSVLILTGALAVTILAFRLIKALKKS